MDTRTAQLLVCSAAAGRGANKEARTRGTWSRLLSFMFAVLWIGTAFDGNRSKGMWKLGGQEGGINYKE